MRGAETGRGKDDPSSRPALRPTHTHTPPPHTSTTKLSRISQLAREPGENDFETYRVRDGRS